MDCPSGCIHEEYFGLVVGDRLVDIPKEKTDISYEVAQKYGETCSFENMPFRGSSVARSVISILWKYYWVYSFHDHSNRETRQARLNSDITQLSLEKNPQYCVLNGQISVADGKAAFTKLRVQKILLPGLQNLSANDLAKKCTTSSCIQDIAQSHQDVSICDYIKDVETFYDPDAMRVRCLLEVAVSSQDSRICDSIPNSFTFGSSERDTCYENVAISSRNVALCEKISTEGHNALLRCRTELLSPAEYAKRCPESSYTYCVATFAKTKNDRGVCDLEKSDESRDMCARYVNAKNGFYPKICATIHDQQEKSNCYRKFAIDVMSGIVFENAIQQNIEDVKQIPLKYLLDECSWGGDYRAACLKQVAPLFP